MVGSGVRLTLEGLTSETRGNVTKGARDSELFLSRSFQFSIRLCSHTSLDIHLKPTSLRKPSKPVIMSAVSKRLEGKTVLITGASSGIGRATAFEFARTAPQNLKLILTARRIDSLKQIAADIVKEVGSGVQVLPVQLDVSKAEEIRSFVSNLPAGFKEVDVLVNNAWVLTSKSFYFDTVLNRS
jgi:hypothetical protein